MCIQHPVKSVDKLHAFQTGIMSVSTQNYQKDLI